MVRLLLLLFVLPIGASLHGQGLRFVENKGQWPAAVAFRAEMSGATVWIENGSLLIDLYDADLLREAHANIHFDREAPLRHHAVRLKFLGATDDLSIEGSDRTSGDHNYFLGNDPAKWASKARAFSIVRMNGIAPGCDAVIRGGGGGLKYDLVLAPGADPSAIRFTYEGADAIGMYGDALIVSTSLGRVTERIPIAYQVIEGERKVISCRYTLIDGVIGIEPGEYDPAYELVIDPTLEFATFSGSFSDNFGYTATFDNAGFLYSGSTAFGTQYPVTTGAYQTTWGGGGTDIAITKYDTTGSFLVWSTYLGGSNSELPHSLYVDENDQLLILGTTGSADFPITAGAYDASFNGGTSINLSGLNVQFLGGSDIVISRLSSNGEALMGSTFLGGAANDGLNTATGLKFNYADEVRGEVLIDNDEHVWIVSTTQSTDMPVTPDAAQAAIAGGSHDGYVAKLDPLLTQLIYASFVGGTEADAIYSADMDPSGRLYFCGGTRSTDLPASPDGAMPAINGGTDGFLGRLSADGASIERLSYWGSPEYDQAYFVQLDGNNDVFILGQTAAANDGPLIFNASYAQNGGGQFITKFDQEIGTAMMSSRIGSGDGDPDISPTAFLVDVCDKIYVSGWGSNSAGLGGTLTTAGLPVTADAHQTNTDGHDLYLAVFEIDMSALIYATYYGGPISREHVDGGTSRFDRRGRIYQTVCAGCGNNDDFPTTPGAWSATNNSSNCNSAVLKMDFDSPLVNAAFVAPDTACAGSTIPFTNLSNGITYTWDFGDGNGSGQPSPVHTYDQPGTYTIELIALDPNSCNEVDSTSRTIVIEDPVPQLVAMNDTLICGPIGSVILSATSNGTSDHFHWSSNSDFSDMLNATPQDSTATIAPAVSGTYHVRAGESLVCSAYDSVTVEVQLADPQLTGDTLICSTDTATLSATGIDPGATIVWSPADEIISGQGTNSITTAPTDDLVFGVDVSTAEGCTWQGTIGVQVSPITGSAAGASVDQPIVIAGTTVQLHATPTEGVTYAWSPGTLVSDPAIADPTALIEQTTTFTVTISDGICTKDASVTVTVYELVCDEPDIFVPNTFTPNGDGSNDLLLVRGRHITEMEFEVFDRWGEKVFESRDQAIGWDGTFKGMEVDPAVFVYHLTAQCLDGQRYFTKGNVTVVR